MKKIFLTLTSLILLTGCPKEEEIKNMEEGIADKKAEAIKTIQNKNYSLEGLLKAQEYFFDFSEKVHLMIVEPESTKNIQTLITKKGINNFCTTFILPISTWQSLEDYCSNGQFYKCSPEIKEYSNTINKFKELIGPKLAQSFASEPACNN